MGAWSEAEGAELRVLKGTTELVHSAHPLILCGLHGAEIGRQVFDYLSEQGYQSATIEYVNENRQHLFAFPNTQAAVYRSLAL